MKENSSLKRATMSSIIASSSPPWQTSPLPHQLPFPNLRTAPSCCRHRPTPPATKHPCHRSSWWSRRRGCHRGWFPFTPSINMIVDAPLNKKFAAIGVRFQGTALVDAYLGEPALVLMLDEKRRHRSGVASLRALHQRIETLVACSVGFWSCRDLSATALAFDFQGPIRVLWILPKMHTNVSYANWSQLNRTSVVNNFNSNSSYYYQMYSLKHVQKIYNNTTNQTFVAKSKKAKNATTVDYKPAIKNKEIRFSNLSNRTLRY